MLVNSLRAHPRNRCFTLEAIGQCVIGCLAEAPCEQECRRARGATKACGDVRKIPSHIIPVFLGGAEDDKRSHGQRRGKWEMVQDFVFVSNARYDKRGWDRQRNEFFLHFCGREKATKRPE